jgi:hypothetical protein
VRQQSRDAKRNLTRCDDGRLDASYYDAVRAAAHNQAQASKQANTERGCKEERAHAQKDTQGKNCQMTVGFGTKNFR